MNILILGKGVSGEGAKELAEAVGFSYNFAVDGDNPEWAKYDMCVASPGFGMDSALIKNALTHNIELISEMEFGFRYYPGKILAITGTNGKTTTTELTCALLQSVNKAARFAGNIGLPLSSLCAEILRSTEKRDTIAVLEVSSFQLEHVEKFSPYAACFINLASDHLNRYHDSLQEYKATKMRIFNGVAEKRKFFGGSMSEKNAENVIKTDGGRIFYKDKKIVDFADCSLAGAHNLENMECALNLVSTVLSEDEMLSQEFLHCLKNFKAGQHRIEQFKITYEDKELTAVDDSKATNPHSVAAACRTFGGAEKKLRIILGGLDKDMDFKELLECVPLFAKCYLIGEAQDKIYSVLSSYVECEKFGKDFKRCCTVMKKEAKNGDILLLSPACASMDMFKNYAQRGDVFKEYMLNS